MENAAELPRIDYPQLIERDPLGHRTPASRAQRHALFSALRDMGFMYLRHPDISQGEVDTLFAHSHDFFAKPLATKMQILGRMDRGRGPSQGYSNPALLAADPSTSDIKEFFGMYRDDDTKRPNQWLDDAQSQAMRVRLVAFFHDCHTVVLELLSALAEEIGMATDALHPFVADKNHFVTCLFYPDAPKAAFKDRVRAAAHTDYGCLTLLFNDGGQGLQVLREDGEFQYVQRMDNCAIVNVGDLLSRFFNGTLPSTVHRVIEPPASTRGSGAEIPDRYSLAFFAHFNEDQLVQPLPAVISEAHPALFEPVRAGEHVKARVKQLHVAGHSLKEPDMGIERGTQTTVVASSKIQ
ncbi:Clavaminate synthase-like protein [Myriangium duriaei CBS 260.36]|uniref:Clavaminate synthase-like protein n=1 Tax=Myriangium duriaei CBS 260.36 TaxID=1168546 RepID=A0A9P4IXJ9_9PEZI|nr:Clavaminate synthase-like protein [Myriangium duriaei CBS 260.36]